MESLAKVDREAIIKLLHIQQDSIFSKNDSSYNQCIILADSFLLSKEFEFAKFPDTYKSKGGSFAYNYKIYLARIILMHSTQKMHYIS